MTCGVATPTPREKPTDAQRERLAREITKFWRQDPDELVGSIAYPLWQHYAMIADYLIATGYLHRDEAMVPQEPTDEMLGAGGVTLFQADMAMRDPRVAVGDIWTAMYAAALRQKGPIDE